MTAADLTAADLELLQRLLAGRTTSEISRKNGIAVSTMGHRVVRLKERIGVRTLVQVGAWCERHGIRESSPT
jgi:DNA-binding CsgD family transcriptional regulator